MKLSEVIELFEQIKLRYDNFSSSKEKRQAWYEDGLKNVSLETALANLRQHHASVEKWAPGLAEISRPLQTENDQYHDYMRESAKAFMAETGSWRSTPPPEHISRMMRLPEPERSEALKAYARDKREHAVDKRVGEPRS